MRLVTDVPDQIPDAHRRTMRAVGGALFLAVLVPSGLVGWMACHKVLADRQVNLSLMAVIGTVPAAMVFGPLLLSWLRNFSGMLDEDEGFALVLGAALGSLLAFANLFAYPVLWILMHEMVLATQDGREFFVFLPLILVTGAICGGWIAWQAYKERHPELGCLPRFSLRTLLLLELTWGGVLWLFRPD